ncbi:DUF4280 domain-containing protein [Candidatus Odyssella thessalonicensis]|uniref:DUF4280 domain-containing protein n=1 Tax=Candidatus Odyssella thessalonicensis TaxID=84647 RepID=UPI000225C061|nr:DUF4280 domain-containing protein [Candidatus Odyssella thessalonicensis]
MTQLLVNSAVLRCNYGQSPCNLIVAPPAVTGCGNPMANIMDFTPANVPGFNMCSSLGNPAVIANAGAPASCAPAITGPWAPGKPAILVRNMPAVDTTCILTCAFGGTISVDFAGQSTVIGT